MSMGVYWIGRAREKKMVNMRAGRFCFILFSLFILTSTKCHIYMLSVELVVGKSVIEVFFDASVCLCLS